MSRTESNRGRRGVSPPIDVILLAVGFFPRTLAALLAAAREVRARILQPFFDGRRGHPVVLPRGEFLDLATTTRAALCEWMHNRQHARHFVPCEDAAVVEDFDTPSQYERALALTAS